MYSSPLERIYQMTTVSLRAAATVAIFFSDPPKEGYEWSRRAGDRPCCLNQHRPCMQPSMLSDAAMIGGFVSGLEYPGIETEIADEFLRRRAAPDIANCRQNAQSDDHVDAGDCHQLFPAWFQKCCLCKVFVDLFQLETETVQLNGMTEDDAALVFRDRLFRQPFPPTLCEKRRIVRWDKIGTQHRMDPVLETGHLGNQLHPLYHDPSQPFRFFIQHPDFRQKAAGVKLRQNTCIDVVGLDLGKGDGTKEQWV